MFIKLKGSYKGSNRNLHLNIGGEHDSGHVALIFNRGERVVLRLVDGIEIPLDDDYKSADDVEEMIVAKKASHLAEVNDTDEVTTD